MKVAILGGSFDPPHLGHLHVARTVRKVLHFDAVVLMPCFQHPFAKELSSAEDRLAMTQLMVEPGISVSDVEIRRPAVSYTIDTLRSLSAEHPDNEYSWIIGSDQLMGFSKWKEWESIVRDFGLIVYPRGSVLPLDVPAGATLLQVPQVSTHPSSSSTVRQAIKHGLPIDEYVTPEVEQYIIKHNLYGI